MRIVSFLPSATELLFELGAGDDIVGVTHECLYPDAAKYKPRVISSVFDPETMSSQQIDEKITELARTGQNIFLVHEENIKNAKPDLIIGQGTCAVCSAYTNEVNRALEILEKRPDIEVIDPHNIDDILSSVITISKKIGKQKQGEELVKSLQKRIDLIKNQNYTTKPKVLCIEWVEPFFTSSHWVPQMIEISGGTNLISKTGEHSRRMAMDEVVSADPDIIVMMPCGFDTKRTILECTKTIQNNPKWLGLRAVKNKNVYAVDANSYFSKPSIRTITGIEILAKIIHPEIFSDINTPEQAYSKI
ncbi:MAG: cobalamin-binding protein [Nitrososphaeria archaeon]|nr:cobalamin-binding protein [Nitrososphaeria archaeon]NDB50778.1 cobalamin-binding protein [Nitrosopumilaceae archaeon]NDF34304.1 cobalamin-binding protein [Nitrosopumilaceae archaeon]